MRVALLGHTLTALGALVALAVADPPAAQAREGEPAGQRVLFIEIDGLYNTDGAHIYQTLVDAGADADFVLLTGSGGQVAAQLAAESYEQVWVYDLSGFSTDPYPEDYAAIGTWFAAHPTQQVICDGRFLSSYWAGRYLTEGAKLTENYYYNLAIRGGGLVIATDDADYHPHGADDVAVAVGLHPFVGSFNLTFIPVDTENALMTTPNDMGVELFDDSSPSQAPFGLQPNGLILFSLAWHSGDTSTPGISTTIEGAVGLHVDVLQPLDGTELCGSPFTATAAATGGDGSYSYTWSSDVDGVLGTGATLAIDPSALTPGTHHLIVTATDGHGLIDDDSVVVSICPGACQSVPAECDQPGERLVWGVIQTPLGLKAIRCTVAGPTAAPVCDVDQGGALVLYPPMCFASGGQGV